MFISIELPFDPVQESNYNKQAHNRMNAFNSPLSLQNPTQPNYMCEYENRQEEEHFQIKKHIYIQNDATLKKQSEPNPNQAVRLARKIFENYVFMIRSIKAMLEFMKNYKYVLATSSEKRRLQNKKLEEGLAPMEENALLELQRIHPPLIINKIVLIKSKQQKQAIYHAINKLKLMVMKARYKQSTTLEYLIDSYIAKLKISLNCYVKYRQEKSENSMMIQLQASSHQFVLMALRTIKNRFDVVDSRNVRYYKFNPASYMTSIHKNMFNQKPILFLNFFTETLLYIDRQYTNFNENLLFCPIVFFGGSGIKISDEYIKLLNMHVGEWTRHQLYLQIYHIETSLREPIFYSKLIHKRESINVHPDRYFPERLKKEFVNFQQMINYLSLIRRCIFAKMIMHWLVKIFHGSHERVEIGFHNKFRVVIRTTSEPVFYEEKGEDQESKRAEYRSEILTNILLFAKDKRHLLQSKQSLRGQIYSLIEASIFKIIAEKAGTRVSWPLECGSLGKHYYEHVKDKPLQRGVVEKYFHNF